MSKRNRAEESRNVIREKLATAVDDLRYDKFRTERGTVDHHRHQMLDLTISEQQSRRDLISSIDTGGFTPAQFQSSRSSRHNKNNNATALSKQSIHEKAIYGANWESKELLKNVKPTVESNASYNVQPENQNVIENSDSMAHEKFSEDPEIRKARWRDLFSERRRALLAECASEQ